MRIALRNGNSGVFEFVKCLVQGGSIFEGCWTENWGQLGTGWMDKANHCQMLRWTCPDLHQIWSCRVSRQVFMAVVSYLHQGSVVMSTHSPACRRLLVESTTRI